MIGQTSIMFGPGWDVIVRKNVDGIYALALTRKFAGCQIKGSHKYYHILRNCDIFINKRKKVIVTCVFLTELYYSPEERLLYLLQ